MRPYDTSAASRSGTILPCTKAWQARRYSVGQAHNRTTSLILNLATMNKVVLQTYSTCKAASILKALVSALIVIPIQADVG